MLAVVVLGFFAGLRTFTAPAVLWLIKRGTPVAYALGVLALVEYAVDLDPKAPARTRPVGLIARACSGGACGWAVATWSGGAVFAAVPLGAFAAIVGAYVGLALRTRAIALIGRVPAAIVEDVVAVLGSVAVVVAI